MGKKLDNILDECLERLLVNGESIEQCLQSHPEQATELKPLLETALAVNRSAAIQPRTEFKARARYEFHSALQEVASRKSRPFFARLPRWATAVTIIAIVLLAGGGTMAAASHTMPDNPLYSVKLASEQVQLTLTPSDINKAELCAQFADRRVEEIIYMANKGDARQVEAVTQHLDNHLIVLASLVLPQEIPPQEATEAPRVLAPTPSLPEEEASADGKGAPTGGNNRAKLKNEVAYYAVNHPAALRNALQKAPESTKPALRQAIDISVAGYEKATNALE